MACDHCEHIRGTQQAILNEHGNAQHHGLYIGSLRNPDPMTVAIDEADYSYGPALQATLANCECDCHVPARIVGKLPRLVPASII